MSDSEGQTEEEVIKSDSPLEESPKDELELTKKELILREAKSLFLIFILVFTFRSSFYEPFKIPSGSMIPTLVIGDFILVNKMSYGFKVPFTEWMKDPVYITDQSGPTHGDVIVFKHPQNSKRDYIKRVVGRPGDEIEIRNNNVYVNGKPVKMVEIEGKKFLEDMDDPFKEYKLKFFKVSGENKDYFIQHNEDEYHLQNFNKIKVPEGQYFVLGDNRDFSNDSRIWGFVPRKNIKGKAIFVWFSMIFPFGQFQFKFRPWRIGKLII